MLLHLLQLAADRSIVHARTQANHCATQQRGILQPGHAHVAPGKFARLPLQQVLLIFRQGLG